MADSIKTLKDYRRTFDSEDKRKRALEYALDIRKFEIDLYWKRTAYYWTLIAVAFAGYFSLSAADEPDSDLVFLVGCVGTILSVSWYLANRGSKYWQENWERHVDSLEDEFSGPLYKATLSNRRWLHLWSAYPGQGSIGE